MMTYTEQSKKYIERSEAALERYLEPCEGRAATLTEVLRYVVLGGGKRIRPQLLFAAATSVPMREGAATPAALDRLAAALEMIHNYSLVHDDLPCMDNDELRRGRATAHIQFGEANALLCGDALLNLAFEVLIDAVSEAKSASESKHLLLAIKLMARRFGQQGMIGGQYIDLDVQGKAVSPEVLEEMDLKKTSALFEAAVLGGAAAAGAKTEDLVHFQRYAAQLGLAFQIRDDLLDVSSDAETMGKSIGKDLRDDKATYVTLLGYEEAQRRAAAATTAALEALEALASAGYDVGFLSDFANALLNRSN